MEEPPKGVGGAASNHHKGQRSMLRPQDPGALGRASAERGRSRWGERLAQRSAVLAQPTESAGQALMPPTVPTYLPRSPGQALHSQGRRSTSMQRYTPHRAYSEIRSARACEKAQDTVSPLTETSPGRAPMFGLADTAVESITVTAPHTLRKVRPTD